MANYSQCSPMINIAPYISKQVSIFKSPPHSLSRGLCTLAHIPHTKQPFLAIFLTLYHLSFAIPI